VPGGGVSIDGERWVACRPNFFLSVRVLSRLFRRVFLQHLDAAFVAGELQFFADLTALKAPSAFKQAAAPERMGRICQASIRWPRAGSKNPPTSSTAPRTRITTLPRNEFAAIMQKK